MSQSYEIAELDRRMGNLLKIGLVSEVDYSGFIPRYRVQVGKLETGWLPAGAVRAGGDRSTWNYEVDEQVVIFSPSGNLEQGIIICALNQSASSSVSQSADKHRTEYKDGAVVEYDREAHKLSAVLPAGGVVHIEAPGGFELVGDFDVQGKITSTGEIKSDTEVSAGDIKLTQHPHDGVEPGTGNSGGPLP